VALTGHFVSQPLQATRTRLSLKVFCGPTTEGVSLQLAEPVSGRRIDLVPRIPGHWQTLIVPAPRNPFRLEVTCQNRETWVAVGDIEELGRLSAYARSLLNQAVTVLLTGLGLSVLLSGSTVFRRGIFSNHFFSTGNLVEWLVFLAGLVALGWVWCERNFTAG